jgi:hypothetical protein
MADTTIKTAEALAAELKKIADRMPNVADCDPLQVRLYELADNLTREALPTAHTAQPQAEPVSDWEIIDAAAKDCAKDGDAASFARGARWVRAAMLAARPPVAPPAPDARREPGWNGPMVNDATPQAEPVAADGWAQSIAKELHKTTVALESDGDPAFAHIIRANRAALAARPPVAQQGAAEAVAWVNPSALLSAKVTRERGGPGDMHTWSETRTYAHSVPLYVSPTYGPNNPPRLRRDGESVEDYRAAMGWPASPAASQPVAQGLTDAQIDAMAMKMADFFMGWPLPDDFHPDGGVSFKPVRWTAGDFGVQTSWPTGTNLLSHEQARKMFRAALSTTHPAQADEGDSRG